MIVAFDLGGVIVDVRRAALWETLGLPREQVLRAFFEGDRHERLSKGALPQASFFESAARALDVELSAIERAWDAQLAVSEGGAALVDAVRADVCAWSNTDPAHFGLVRPGLPARLWSRRALSYEVRAWKPEPLFYARALELAGEDAAAVLFLDDRAANVEAARAVGIDAAVACGVAGARRALEERGLLGA